MCNVFCPLLCNAAAVAAAECHFVAIEFPSFQFLLQLLKCSTITAAVIEVKYLLLLLQLLLLLKGIWDCFCGHGQLKWLVMQMADKWRLIAGWTTFSLSGFFTSKLAV